MTVSRALWIHVHAHSHILRGICTNSWTQNCVLPYWNNNEMQNWLQTGRCAAFTSYAKHDRSTFSTIHSWTREVGVIMILIGRECSITMKTDTLHTAEGSHFSLVVGVQKESINCRLAG